jgi:hypothetical protein
MTVTGRIASPFNRHRQRAHRVTAAARNTRRTADDLPLGARLSFSA